ncbi:hypothetical protein QN224_21040 [Sinorhizobium sp. 8-89]|nr:hypothetical protein [Sinorhizobium sp. 7-81]MDK1387908.1 hypothetical protein [Sinorhizobium sp. 7-81]
MTDRVMGDMFLYVCILGVPEGTVNCNSVSWWVVDELQRCSKYRNPGE